MLGNRRGTGRSGGRSARRATREASDFSMLPGLVTRAIQLMNESIDEPRPPLVIAREVGISGRQMERLFGRYLRCSPKKYYVDLRLQKAQRLLVQTDMSVTDVAFTTGFNSRTHFSKTYRVQFGVSPKDQKNKID